MSEEDKERFEIFSRLPNDEKVKLIMRYQKRIDKALEFIKKNYNPGVESQFYWLEKILRGDSDESN